jgi:hypothetical protein
LEGFWPFLSVREINLELERGSELMLVLCECEGYFIAANAQNHSKFFYFKKINNVGQQNCCEDPL